MTDELARRDDIQGIVGLPPLYGRYFVQSSVSAPANGDPIDVAPPGSWLYDVGQDGLIDQNGLLSDAGQVYALTLLLSSNSGHPGKTLLVSFSCGWPQCVIPLALDSAMKAQGSATIISPGGSGILVSAQTDAGVDVQPQLTLAVAKLY